MNEVVRTLRTAADLLEQRGWGQGGSASPYTAGSLWGMDDDFNPDHPLCLEGAIAVASGLNQINPFTMPYSTSQAVNECPAGQAVQEYLGTYVNFMTDDLYAWNDMAGRTQQEVIDVLRDVATLYEIRNGDIGDNPREVEFEPLTAPSVPEPVPATPTPEPVKEPQPA